jgi:hypothetical protein
MPKKICKKIKEGKKIKQHSEAEYLCKTCSAASISEKELCKPKKIKRA